MSRQIFAAAIIAALVLFGFGAARAEDMPAGYPAEYVKIIDAARKEGKAVVYATTDAAIAAPLIKDFEALYAGIRVEYTDLNSTELYNRLIAEGAAGQGTADLTWSSAPDLQLKLAVDGYIQAYDTPESIHVPPSLRFRNLVYGTTADPVAFVYNKRLVPVEDVPASHADLLKLLTAKPDSYKGKITSYDPERSGVGFNFYSQDERVWKESWALNRAFGKVGLKTYTSAGAMIEKVLAGEHLIAYGVFGSYAISRAAKDPNLGIVLPKDYLLITTRAAAIPAKAKNPNAGRLFLDYLLSERGQKLIAGEVKLYAVRSDVQGEATMGAIVSAVGTAIRPIALNDALLEGLDQTKRLRFLKDWRKAMKGE